MTVAERPRVERADRQPDVLDWLLESTEPALRWLVRTAVLGRDESDPDVARERARITRGRLVSGLLHAEDSLERPRHPYAKWHGAHWRLVSLVQLGLPPGNRAAIRQYQPVLAWLTGPGHLRGVPRIEGRARRCASQEGNALGVGVRLGLAKDERVQLLAQNLVGWQWRDGGWNCDTRPAVTHSSVNESIAPLWGLSEYAAATGDRAAREAASRTAEFFLDHELFRSHRTGRVMHPNVMAERWPPYWHYDYLYGLVVLTGAGKLPDRRADAALDMLLERRRQDGTWRAIKRWWKPPGSATQVEAVDWRENDTEDRMVTIAALSALRAAGREIASPGTRARRSGRRAR